MADTRQAGAIARVEEGNFGRTSTTAIERRTAGDSAMAKHGIEARFSVALARPRNMRDVETELVECCRDYAFADHAVYALPRGGKSIEGLSIRFAEEALRVMQNVDSATVVVAEDERTRTVRQTLTDLETNRTFSSEFIIEKTQERRTLKQGQESLGTRLNSNGEIVHLVGATEADMYGKTGILVSKALRDNLLRILPFRIKHACFEVAKKTADAGPAGETREAVIRKIAGTFAEWGVKVSDIETYLGHSIDQLTDDERKALRGLAAAIRDGHTTWQDAAEEKAGGKTRKTASKATGDLGTMKAGDGAAHQGHAESAATTKAAKDRLTKKAAQAEAALSPPQSPEPEPAALEESPEEPEPPESNIPEIEEDDLPFDAAGYMPASVEAAAKMKADTIREIESTLDGMGYPVDVVPTFAVKLGLPGHPSIADYTQIELNHVLDAIVREKKSMAERDRAAEIKQKAAGRSDVIRAEIAETRELLKGVAAYATDAKWRSAVAAALIPEPFDGNIDACDEAKLTKILGLNRKWMAKVGVGAKA